MSYRLVGTWALLIMVFIFISIRSQAQMPGWQSVVIAEAGFNSGDLVYNSDLFVTADGTAYIVWADLSADIFLSAIPSGATMQPGEPINVSMGDGGDWPVAPAVSLGGSRLCVAWEGWDDLGGDIFLRCSADSGQSWLSDPKKIAETATPSGQSELQGEWDGHLDVFVNAQGIVYVAWLEDFTKLVWSKSEDGQTFSQPQAVFDGTPDSLRWPHWASDAQGNLYLVYNQTLDESDVYFFRTSDGGVTWNAAPIQVTNNLGFSDAPEWAFIGQKIYNVNDDTTDAGGGANILLTVSQDRGQTWSQSVAVTEDGGFPSIASDGTNLYVSFSDGSDAELTGFVCSTDDGQTWKREDVPDSGPNFVFLGLEGPGTDASETTIAVDAQGKVYIAWARGSRKLGKSQILLATRSGC